MTYRPHYTLVVKPGTYEHDLTLYEACKRLEQLGKAGEAVDVTHVRKNGRHVAFWCGWDHRVKAMFDANDAERTQIG